MSFPIKNGGSFHSYVKLPESIPDEILWTCYLIYLETLKILDKYIINLPRWTWIVGNSHENTWIYFQNIWLYIYIYYFQILLYHFWKYLEKKIINLLRVECCAHLKPWVKSMVSCRMSHSKQSMETQYGSKLQARRGPYETRGPQILVIFALTILGIRTSG